MPLPDFFVVGAPRAGTTALYRCLRQHPEIFMSASKEPRFFGVEEAAPVYRGPGACVLGKHAKLAPREYFSLFAGAGSARAVGEASTLNLYSPVAARRIREHVPHARIVALLRQPAERAHSEYLFVRYTLGADPAPDFARALALEEERRHDRWPEFFRYRDRGFYYAQLRRYYEAFPPAQIRVYLHEEWRSDPRAVLRDLFRFLGVDEAFRPELALRNPSRAARSYRLNRIAARGELGLGRARRLVPKPLRNRLVYAARTLNERYNRVPPPPLDPELRRRLTEGYRDDILRLQQLVGRDLSHWLEG